MACLPRREDSFSWAVCAKQGHRGLLNLEQSQYITWFVFLLPKGLINLEIRLQVFVYYADDNNWRKSFRFAVVDFSKSKSYPQNFVCMLPSQFGKGKTDSAFLKLFGDKSLEQAKALLKAAWAQEDDSEIKAEIERRLKLLEPKGVDLKKCSSCGKLFQPRGRRKFKNSFCEECMKKRFGNRV